MSEIKIKIKIRNVKESSRVGGGSEIKIVDKTMTK